MPVSDAAVKELREKCGLPAKACRAALAAHGGDVNAALAALIDSGKVRSAQLNPDQVSDELFARAQKRGFAGMIENLAKRIGAKSEVKKRLPGFLSMMR